MKIVEELQEINVKMALDLLGGYEQIYEKIIVQFRENQKNLLAEVTSHLKSNLSEARRLVHSCKGISKNIGSEALYDSASKLEQAILDDNKPFMELYFLEFKDIFQRVMVDLNHINF